jgi:hypothetical protein
MSESPRTSPWEHQFGEPGSRGGEHAARSGGVCCICHDALGAFTASHCSACCQTIGHRDCAVAWLDNYSNTCPLCRAPDPLLLAPEARAANSQLGPGPPAESAGRLAPGAIPPWRVAVTASAGAGSPDE